MYKRAGRVYQRLQAQRVVGQRAKAPKGRGVVTLPGIGLIKRPKAKSKGTKQKRKRAAKVQGRLRPKSEIKVTTLNPVQELQVARGLVAAFARCKTVTIAEVLRKMPLRHGSEGTINGVIQEFVTRHYVATTKDGTLANLSLRRLERRILDLTPKLNRFAPLS